jgi:ubiquinone biosynthesis protein COQ9
VPFDGWTARALDAAVADAGLPPGAAARLFPGGLAQVAEQVSDWADRRMLARLAVLDGASMRMRERIATAVRARLEVLAPHREAVRRLLGYLALPGNVALSLRLTYRTVDAMWYAAGDRAADFSFYTKRALLAGVHGATTLFWLADRSEGFADTWAFLDRRIDDVMRIPKLRGRLEKSAGRLFRTPSAFRPPSASRTGEPRERRT